MSRLTDSDFEILKKYMSDYSLVGALSNCELLSKIRSAHRDYLPFLQLWSICLDQAGKGGFSFFGREIDKEKIEFAHLRETVSDVGSGLFCCLHGAYKPGHMALRSSIENFLRFSSGPFNVGALSTTSVYDLFDIAKNVPPYAGERKTYLERLRCSYSDLCKFSHSASLNHMAGIHALAHFPTFNTDAIAGWIVHARNCMSSMATLSILGQPSIYLKSHYAVMELLDRLLPSEVRLMLLRGGV